MTPTPSPAPAAAGEGTERPGGWVDGIGWVALLADLNGDDLAAVHPGGQSCRAGGVWASSAHPVVVVRWADGTTPAPPAPSTPAPHADAATIEAWLMEGGPDGMAHWLYAPDHLAADDYEGDDPMSEADLVLFRQTAARTLGERLALKFAATPPSAPVERPQPDGDALYAEALAAVRQFAEHVRSVELPAPTDGEQHG